MQRIRGFTPEQLRAAVSQERLQLTNEKRCLTERLARIALERRCLNNRVEKIDTRLHELDQAESLLDGEF